MAQKKGGMTAGKIAAVGAGVAALGAAAFYFMGPDGKKHQKDAKTWMVKMQKDIAKKAKQVKNMTEPMYHKLVDGVVKPYMAKNMPDTKEIAGYATKLKKEWKNIVKMMPAAKKAVSKAKKVVKKAVKKAAPKKKR